MTANGNHKPFHTSDGLVVRNVKRNVIGSRERQSIQTPLEGGRQDDSSYHPKKSEKERRDKNKQIQDNEIKPIGVHKTTFKRDC